jgi:hypothetical protein
MAAPKGNKYGLGNNGGQPPKFESAEELASKAKEYFEFCEGEYEMIGYTDDNGNEQQRKEWIRTPTQITITGLALALGFESRQSFYDNEKRDGFSYIIKKCRMIVENAYELALSGGYPTGAIFALKNMGWKDKTEVESNVNITNEVFKIGDTEIIL